MDALDWITLAVFFALGCWVGSAVASAIDRAVFKSLLDDLGITREQLVEIAHKNYLKLPGVDVSQAADEDGLEVINIKLETHNGMIYAFRKDTDQFLGQGADREQLIARLKERLTQVRLIITQEDGAALIQDKENT